MTSTTKEAASRRFGYLKQTVLARGLKFDNSMKLKVKNAARRILPQGEVVELSHNVVKELPFLCFANNTGQLNVESINF